MENKDSFYISKQTKRGILIFFGLFLLIAYTPRFIGMFHTQQVIVVPEKRMAELQLKDINKPAYHRSSFSSDKYKSKKRTYHRPFRKFDPNTYSVQQWMELGLSEKQAQVVKKYTRYTIYSNEQLQKIVVISPELFELIKDSTVYPVRSSNYQASVQSKNAAKEVLTIDLNSADTTTLIKLPGIGSYFARKIVAYREKLGGFVKKEQLLEIYHLDIEKYSAIEPYIQVNPNEIHKIHLNTATAEQLKSHPYLNWNIANSIVKIRQQKGGSFHQIDDIRGSVLIDQERYEKLKPYLDL